MSWAVAIAGLVMKTYLDMWFSCISLSQWGTRIDSSGAWLMKLLAVGWQLWGFFWGGGGAGKAYQFVLSLLLHYHSLSFKKYEMLETMLFEVTLHQWRLQKNLAACFPFLSSISQMGVFPLQNKSGVAAIVNAIFLTILTGIIKDRNSPVNSLFLGWQIHSE